MKVYEDYTIKGPWQEGDPDRVLETIYRETPMITTTASASSTKPKRSLRRN